MTTADTEISCAATALRAGGAVIFPTDTVYGLGVAVGPARTPAQLFELKQRPSDKPVAWLVGSVDALQVYGSQVPPAAFDLAKRFWPGALTLIIKANERVPKAFQSAAGTVGLRMPDSQVALALLQEVGVPLATTSANISGQPAAVTDAQLDERLVAAAAAVIRGYDCPGGTASTVIDCTSDTLKIVRPGPISLPEQE